MRAKRSRTTWRLACESLEARLAPALLPQMLIDINKDTMIGAPSGPQSSQYEWKEFNGAVYFQGDDQPLGYGGEGAGTELWRTDGTAAGTYLVKDIYPGFYGSGAGNFEISNGTLFFTADHPAHGAELWKTNGTAAGTVMVKDVDPGPGGNFQNSYIGDLVDINGTLFFSAQDNSWAIWRSDGTTAGTYEVKTFQPGNYGGLPNAYNLIAVGNTLFFTAAHGAAGRTLWRSDGTEAGTVMVKDLRPDSTDLSISNLTSFNGLLYFTLWGDATNGEELWRSDGTEAGTFMVKDINPGTAHSYPRELTPFNGHLYFTANNPTNGRELWRTDGTTAGTVLAADIQAGSSSSSPEELTVANGALFFSAYGASFGKEVWKTDGTAAGTTIVVDLVPGSTGSNPKKLTVLGNRLAFSRQNAALDEELWVSDGTAAGTALVRVINPGMGVMTTANHLSVAGGLYFSADDGTYGREVWKTDGTADGTVMVKDINTLTADSAPQYGYVFTQVGPTTFIAADDGVRGVELWKTDGTVAGTVMVKDIKPGGASGLQGSSSATRFAPVVMDGILYFAADDGVNGRELWRSDGTAAGTFMVKNINSVVWNPPLGSNPRDLVVMNGRLYFGASGGTGGWYQLWQSDGTASGTTMVKDVSPSALAVIGNTLFFAGAEGTTVNPSPYGVELWTSDGTSGGTVMVKDIYPGINGGLSTPAPIVVGNTLYFVANDGTSGNELWRSDGTAAGTYMVEDTNPGTASGASLTIVAVMNGVLYFPGSASGGGSQLWRSDGTAAGTYRVATPSVAQSSVAFTHKSFGVLNGVLFFQANDGTHMNELWRTDGTTAGTYMVKDIMNPDPYMVFGSAPALMAPFNGGMYFSADDWHHGRELWRSDGTTAGTVLLNINELRLSAGSTDDLAAYPGEMTPINGTLYFSAEEGRHGREIWTLANVPPAAAIAAVLPSPRNTAVSSLTITFNTPVTGFDLADLTLTRDGTAVSLAGATLTSSDNRNFTLGNLSGVTAAGGTYVLKLTATGAGIRDTDNMAIVADALTSWVVDLTPPSPTDVIDVTPDPRNAAVATVDVTFTELIDPATLTAAGVTLTRNGSPVNVTGFMALDHVSGTTYRISGLGRFTGADGTYVITVNGAGLKDLVGNTGSGTMTDSWVMDGTPPVATDVVDVSPDPRQSAVASVDVTFSEPIDLATFTGADVTLTRNGTVVSLSGLTTSSVSGSTYRVSGLTAFTGTDGVYVLTVNGPGVTDPVGNVGTGTPSDTWEYDLTGPTVSVVGPVVPDPRRVSVATVDVTFSEPLDGNTFTTADLTLTRDGANVPLPGGASVAPVSGSVYRVSGLDPATAAAGQYVLTVNATGVKDVIGNTGTGSGADTWVMDLTAPAVTDVVDVTPDPRNAAVPTIDVTFTEPMSEATFTFADLTLTRDGANVPLTSAVTAALLSGSTYRVSGLAAFTGTEGAYTLTVDGTGITDLAGNPGTGTAADAWRTDTTRPTATDVLDVSPDPRRVPVGSVDVIFSEPLDLTTFTTADVSLTRNGGSVPLSGLTVTALGGSAYRVDGLGAFTTADGAYTLTVAGAGVTDVVGNAGTGSPSDAWVMDATGPTAAVVAVTPDPRNTAVSQLAIAFVEPVSGFDVGDLTLRRDGTVVPLAGTTMTTADNVTYTLGGLAGRTGAEGAYTLTLTAAGAGIADAAGNPMTADATGGWLTDLTAPTATIQPLPAYSPANVPVSWAGTDAGGSGVGTFDVYVSVDGGPLVAWLTATPAADGTYPGAGGHTYGFAAAATDRAGNAGPAPTAVQATTAIDTTAPTAAVAPLPTVSPAAVAVTWSGSDAESGVATFDVYVSDDGGPLALWLAGTAATAGTFTGQDGHTYGFAVVATDRAGNAGPLPTDPQATTTVDDSAPTSLVAALAAFNLGTFTVSWFAPDAASFDVHVSDDGGPFTVWLAGTTATAADFTGQDGHTYDFYSRARDAVGNLEPAPAGPDATTTVDNAAPTAGIGALPAYAHPDFDVSWSADDAGGSGTASFDVYVSADGGPFAVWRAGTTATSGTFTGQDEHAYGFAVVATDALGHRLADPTAAQATTTVDDTVPTAAVVSLPAFEPRTFAVAWGGQDAGSGVATFDVYVSDNGGPLVPWLTDTTTTSADFTGQDGHAYGFAVAATDALGLEGPAPTAGQATTTVDDTPPTTQVNPLPEFEAADFEVSWAGSDAGSGLVSFDVLVSTDGGPWDPWLTNTTDTAAAFAGEPGSFYAFVSVGVDAVGNREAPPAVADAETGVFALHRTLTPVGEDARKSAGVPVTAILGSALADADPIALRGIAVTGLTGTGRWQFSADGKRWKPMARASTTAAWLLPDTYRVRFLPARDWVGAARLTFRGWDRTWGTAGKQAIVPAPAAGSPFTAQAGSASITVTPANDRPTLKPTAVRALPTPPAPAVGNGQLVSGLVGGATDVDGDPLGAAIVGYGGAGTWQFSTNAGGSWSDVDTVTATQAILLRPTDLVRFVAGGGVGTQGTLTVKAWDQSSGAVGSPADTRLTTAFSRVSVTATTLVNNAPVMAGDPLALTMTEDMPGDGFLASTLLGGTSADDAGSPTGIAVTAADGRGHGRWQFATDGKTWRDVAAPVLLRAGDRVRFLPTADFFGTGAAALTFKAWDQTFGTAGGTADVSAFAPGAFFSSAGRTATLAIDPADDRTVLDAGTSPALPSFLPTEAPTTARVGDLLAGRARDPDRPVVGLQATDLGGTGTWDFSTDGQAWSPVASGQFLGEDARLRFTPAGDFRGVAGLGFRAWDGRTGPMAVSRETGRITVAVNVAPALTVAQLALPDVAEDATNPAGVTVGALFGSTFADAEGVAAGLAITAAPTAGGTWQYRTGRAAWTAVGTVGEASALLLGAADRVRFLPAANFHGTAGLTVKPWDGTAGTAGGRADATAGGGSSAFGGTPISVWVNVRAASDRPAAGPGLIHLASAPVTVADLLAGRVADADGTPVGMALTGLTTPVGGKWELSLNGTDWLSVGAVSPGKALLLAPTDLLRFVPPAGFNGSATIRFRAWDLSRGVTHQYAPVSTLGDGVSKATLTAAAWVNTTPNLRPD